MFDRRGWTRSRARDYYDLWRVLSAYKDDLDHVFRCWSEPLTGRQQHHEHTRVWNIPR